MAEDWAGIADEVTQALGEVGQTATLTKSVASGSAYNPTLTKSNSTLAIVVMEYKQREIDGTMIVRGDKKIYAAVGTVDPVVGDELTIGGVRHQVIMVKPTSPAGTVVMQEIQARP